MFFKHVVQKSVYVQDGALIELDDNKSFKISLNKTENGCICYVQDIKGNFDIINVTSYQRLFIPSYSVYDKNSKSFSVPTENCQVTLNYSIDVEYTNCMLFALKIPKVIFLRMKVLEYYKNVFTLPDYKDYKFVYYVRKNNEKRINVHVLNPYDDILIEDKKGDFESSCYAGKNFDDLDIYFSLRFTFESQTVNVVENNLEPSPVDTLQPDNNTVKCPLLYDIMSDKTYADVVLFSSTGKEILTYRCILAKYSKIFKSLFEEKTELPVQIKMKEFDTDTITAALEFCYGKIDAIIGKESDVFKFADKYEIQEIKEACCTYFETNLNTTNVCSIIEIAYSNNFEDLKEKCKIFIAKNKEEIEFGGLSKNILIDVLKAL